MGTNDLFVICDGGGGLFNSALVRKTILDSIITDFTIISAVEPVDQLLLCSDGLSNFLMEPDIIHAITNNSQQDATELMGRKCLTKEIGAPDNFTRYIIQI